MAQNKVYLHVALHWFYYLVITGCLVILKGILPIFIQLHELINFMVYIHTLDTFLAKYCYSDNCYTNHIEEGIAIGPSCMMRVV